MVFVEPINVINGGTTVLHFWHYIPYPIYSCFTETAEKFYMRLIPRHQGILLAQGVDGGDITNEETTNTVNKQ
jgi:hypothetical protein